MNSRNKWNSKYTSRLSQMEEQRPNKRLMNNSHHLKGGVALDLACGLGANSFYLADLYNEVHALDISDVAIQYVKDKATKHSLPIYPHLCDLTDLGSLNLSVNSYDLVVVTYYLDRTIFPFVKSIIKENGYFFMETYYNSPLNVNNQISNGYKLQSKELLSIFDGWKIHYYEENEQEGRQTILCQKNNGYNGACPSKF